MQLSQSDINYAHSLTGEVPWVIKLGDVTPEARDWVGEKAYRLARLSQAGFRVPKGYCITVSAYQHYLASRDNNPLLAPELCAEILRIHRSLKLITVAVRSSALDEDQHEASAAGIYPSYLNIRQEANLLNAVAGCFDSANCSEAQRYRRLHHHDELSTIAVFVQAQVEASSSGILFSTDPITGNPDHIHINAILGLGEPLTAGKLTPDHYVMDRHGKLIRQTVAEQAWMHTAKGRKTVPKTEKKSSTLSVSQLSELHCLAKKVEQHEDMAVDIEFAFDAFGIQLLQVRPITCAAFYEQKKIAKYIAREKILLQQRLAELRQQGRLKQSNSILSNGNIAELLPSPTPMSFGLFDLIFAGRDGAIIRGRQRLGYQLAADACDGLFQLMAGQPFFLLEIDAYTYDIGIQQPVARIHKIVEQNPELANYPELGLYEQLLDEARAEENYPHEEARLRLETLKNFNLLQRQHANAFDDDMMAAMEQRWRNYLNAQNAIRLEDLELPGLTERLNGLIKHLQQETCREFVSIARLGFYFYDLCRVRLLDLTPQEQTFYLTVLFLGLQETPISSKHNDLEEVCRGTLTMSEYLHRYGHLATNELEVSLPRYHEDPGPLMEMIRARTSLEQEAERSQPSQQGKRIASEKMLENNHMSHDAHPDFWFDLRLAQRFLPLREHVKYFFLAEYDLVRSTLLEIESRLQLEPGDIFYLYPHEISACCESLAKWRRTITKRRTHHQLASYLAEKNRVPAVLFEKDLGKLGVEHQLSPADSWQGQAVSPGYIEGVACVVETLDDLGSLQMDLGPEHVLVIPSLNLGLSALLGNLGGLIVEIGGLLAHSACQARERGIPAAVLPGATAMLNSGDRIRLDGANGLIQLA
ncbi:MAG: hypothetical protein JRE63_02125 [Deltaproteobacteria bacterium]|jgi:pyruvate,water dikinase|nr:hypothetical protein [Deltaproteobacteria bacterium]MBW2519694.1 hypothetical protein [Deltaproteobacteria bacterium]